MTRIAEAAKSNKANRVISPVHDDLGQCCLILDPRPTEGDMEAHDCGSDGCAYHDSEDTSALDEELPYQIPGDYIKEIDSAWPMLYDDCHSDRVEATRELLDARPDLGLPYIVYARDSAQSDAEIEEFYKKGLKLLFNENDLFSRLDKIDERIEDLDPNSDSTDERNELTALKKEKSEVIEQCAAAKLGVYRLDPEGICLLAFELARFQWRQGRKEDAIATLQDTTKRLSLDELNDYDDYIQPLLFNYLMQLKRLEEAQTVLDTQPDTSPLWLLCRALVLYAQTGDNVYSRSPLQMALEEDRNLATLLLSKKDEPSLHKIRVFSKETFEPVLYELRCAWHSVSGSSDWLSANFAHYSPNTVLQSALASSSSKAKLKRWEVDYTAAQNAIDNDALPEAKNRARAALREVRSEVALIPAFTSSIQQILLLSGAFPNLRAEAQEHLNYHRQRELTDSTQTLERLERLMSIASCLGDLKMFLEAAELQKKALELGQVLIAKGDPYITAYGLSAVRFDLGFSLGELRKYAEARELFQETVNEMKNVFAADHPYFVKDLDLLFRCLHREGEHATEEEVKALLLRCFKHKHVTWEDEHKTHGDNCPWFIGECPNERE